MTIAGAGQSSTIVQAGSSAATAIDRVFEVEPGGNATFQDLTIQHGNPGGGDGGGINAIGDNNSSRNASVTLSHVTVQENVGGRGAGINNNLATVSAALTITDSLITGNQGTNRGGGIDVTGFGTLYLTRSTVSNNSTSENAGGIALHVATSAVITDSTISNNTATYGGGILTFGGSNPLKIFNSTISDNTATAASGGIHADADLTIVNSTITGNHSSTGGGGILLGAHNQTLDNTIVAGNFEGSTPNDIAGNDTINTASNDLIGDASSSAGISNGGNGNIVGNAGAGTIDITTVLNTTLADNGGPTFTHALVTGSPALDAGSNTLAVDANGNSLTTDQRGSGFPRVVGAAVDIGAFEVQPSVSAPSVISPAATSITNTTATLGGDVTSDGGTSLSTRGVLFALTSVNNNPTLHGSGVTEVDDASATTGAFTENITGLTAGSGYSYVVFATNSVGTSYTSLVSTFTTAPPLGTTALVEGPAAAADAALVAQTGAWTAQANVSWLHTTSSGSGNGLATFTFDANSGATRTGTLTIAGETLTITQAGSSYGAANPVTTLANSGLHFCYGVAVDGAGNVYIADSGNNALKEWNASTQQVSTIVSSGLGLNDPTHLAVDSAGNVYIADYGDNAIKEWITSTQTLTTLVSTGLNGPVGVAVDSAGNVYIADALNNAIKEWSVATQQVSTLISSGLHIPEGVAVDSAGNLYIADSGNNALKEYNVATQMLSTLVGTGLNGPYGVAVDGSGNVYLADSGNNALKEWNASTQQVSTLIAAGLNIPFGVAVDGAGNVYLADYHNSAIKEYLRAFVPGDAISEAGLAGSDQLLPVLPTSALLTGVFAPSSDQSWLTVGSTANDVVHFSFTTNATGAARTGHLTVLGQPITVNQAFANPTVVSVTPSLASIADAQVGQSGFQVSVTFSAAMNTSVVPTIGFSPAISSTLTFASGSWNGAGTVYTAVYNVADAGISVPSVAINVSGAQGGNGVTQVSFTQNSAFTVDTTNPTVTSITPSAALLTDVQVGNSGFSLSVAFNAAMNTAVAPIINFSPAVSSTLTFASGNWNTAKTIYTAVYNVVNAGVSVPSVAVGVTNAKGANGNSQVGVSQNGVFAINTLNPAVTALAPSVSAVTDSTTSLKLTVTYGVPMNRAINPTITFSPSVSTSLTLASGTWNTAGTVYTASYNVVLANVNVPSVGVTINGAKDTHGNSQLAFTQNGVFSIDTTNPTVTSITPSAAIVANAQVGKAGWSLAIQYSAAMNPAIAPTLSFSPVVSTTLTFASGSWNGAGTVYTAVYNVTHAGVSVSALAVTVSGAHKANGNLQTALTQSNVFAIDTVSPVVTSITPSVPIITAAQVGSATFQLAVQYNTAMNPAVAPTLSFNPSVNTMLTLASGSWNAAHTLYTATYNVAGTGLSLPAIAVTVRGAQKADGNLQTLKSQNAVFSIDTVIPTVTQVTPSVGIIANAEVGSATFRLAIQYSTVMSSTVSPTISFSPSVSSTLTFASGSWNSAHTIYTAVYNVANAKVNVSGIAVTVSGAKNAHGNLQASANQSSVFAIDTVSPAITSVTPSVTTLTDAQMGSTGFSVATAYSIPMNTAILPTLSFSPDVSTLLTFAFGSWDASGRIYTATYSVSGIAEQISAVAVTLSGGQSSDGNVPASLKQNSLFAVDTVSPTITALTPSVATITNAQLGNNGFHLSVTYSEAMNPAVSPTISFSPDVGSTLTFASGSWNASHTIYTASFNVADAALNVSSIEVTVSDAQSSAGNLQTPFGSSAVFGISTT